MAKTKTKQPKRSEVLWNAYLAEVQKEQEDSKPTQISGWKVFDAALGVGIAIVSLALVASYAIDSQPTAQPTYQVEVGQ